jgi:hypothetical protein
MMMMMMIKGPELTVNLPKLNVIMLQLDLYHFKLISAKKPQSTSS